MQLQVVYASRPAAPWCAAADRAMQQLLHAGGRVVEDARRLLRGGLVAPVDASGGIVSLPENVEHRLQLNRRVYGQLHRFDALPPPSHAQLLGRRDLRCGAAPGETAYRFQHPRQRGERR
eukprot:CAMPEP_0181203862 /NCGR_PEP_ID=MMETSP1096-20121128/19622_1 /TAXON_ID=156174 ORGANISM="Chrysochromulina ericina, Strain CCMP281" /NCGR_SAMPLE_ID=MMETSP1096 /ASSEMBLY_ACC=CAM_ASM_000453 /LENGTH=119 /DNA_ID=CAMNT_0023294511 /DNA_START=266 /DNA_END=626 /DNA_ORIENTATION=-